MRQLRGNSLRYILLKHQGKLYRTLLFDTAEMYETMIKIPRADEGQKQKIEKIKKYLHRLVNDESES